MVGADIEHIKCFVNAEGGEQMMCSNIHKHSECGKRCENACGANEILEAQKVLISECKIGAEEHLSAVVNHCLNVYEYLRCENVVWENVNTSACEEAEGGKENDGCIAEFAVFSKGNYWQHVKRRGAELEWEGVPSVIPNEFSIYDRESKEKLLDDFKHDYCNPEESCQASDGLFAGLFEKADKQYRNCQHNSDTKKMI